MTHRPLASELETERLSLRPLGPDDVGWHHELVGERDGGPSRTAAAATGRERLWSTVRTWNAPSFRVLEKLGFHRDHVEVDDRGEIVYLRVDLR